MKRNKLIRPIAEAIETSWFKHLARWGIAARGLVYFVVGLLAAQAALGLGGITTDFEGGLAQVVRQPFGQMMLIVIILGLIAYICWCFTKAILDPENKGEQLNISRLIERVSHGIAGLFYSGLTFAAVRLLLGFRENGNEAQTRQWTAIFLSEPIVGRWLVGIAGAVVLGVGIAFINQALHTNLCQYFKLYRMGRREQGWAIAIGRFGMIARGLVTIVIGAGLIRAALRFNSNEAKGFGGALAALAQPPFGTWLLGLVALGLIAFSLYSLLEARYRQIIQ